MNSTTKPILTMSDVIDEIGQIEDITPKKRTEFQSAIRTLLAAANRSPKEVLAHPPEVRRLIEETPWQATDLAPASVSNKTSLLRAGMRAVGINVERQRRKLDVTAEWQCVLNTIPKRYLKPITPFGNWASATGLSPDDVDLAAFERYLTHLEECTVQRGVRERWLSARRAWNAWLRTVHPDRPTIPLDKPLRARSLPWSFFTTELLADVGRWRQWAGHVDFDEMKRRPLKKLTLDGYVWAFQRIGTLLCNDGADREDFTRLETFFDAGRPKRLRLLIQGNATVEEARDRLRAIFCALLAAARWLEATRPDVMTDERRAGVAYAATVVDKLGRRRKMADSNKAKLAKLRDPRIGRRFRNLAAIVANRHPFSKKLSVADALELQFAALHVLLQEAPIRMGNAVGLDLDRHIVRPMAGGDGPWLICIPEEETKNDRAINLKLTKFGSALVADYIARARPLLLKEPTKALFISQTGTRKTRSGLSTQYGNFVEREVGVRINAHLNRHICASGVINETGGDFNRASKILGHGNAETTAIFYTDFEAEIAQKTWLGIVEQGRKDDEMTLGPLLARAIIARRAK